MAHDLHTILGSQSQLIYLWLSQLHLSLFLKHEICTSGLTVIETELEKSETSAGPIQK